MSRPNPIQYAERLYAAIRAANFSPISFLTFGNAVKDGVELRRMPRIAAEPFMRVVGEMLDLEEEATTNDVIDAGIDRSANSRGSGSSTLSDSDVPTGDNLARAIGSQLEEGEGATASAKGTAAPGGDGRTR